MAHPWRVKEGSKLSWCIFFLVSNVNSKSSGSNWLPEALKEVWNCYSKKKIGRETICLLFITIIYLINFKWKEQTLNINRFLIFLSFCNQEIKENQESIEVKWISNIFTFDTPYSALWILIYQIRALRNM